MKKALLFLAALASLVAASPAAAATTTVAITRAGFVPEQVTIRVGDVVTWVNQDTQAHQVVSQTAPEAFASPVLQPGATFSRTFRNAGTYRITDPLNRNRRMTVVVQAGPAPPGGAVTIAARPQIVVYGGSVTITGSLANQRAGERVTLFAQACGATFTRVTDATTTTGGTFMFTVKPLNNTTYRVQYRNQTSASVAVKVRPRLLLGRVGVQRFSLRVFASASFAGKVAVVQRYNATLRRWVRVRLVTLRATTLVVAPTQNSAVTFRARIRARSRVRVLLPQAQVGGCYLFGRSNVVRA